jgi:uncharacterized protein (TIGR02444 family)
MTQIATTSASPSSFWTFSLSVYGQPGVPAACLTLQDEGGADVNLLLFALYLGRAGRKLTGNDVLKIAQTTEPWRAGIVVALRAARRALKEPPAPFAGPLADHLRKSVKSAELEAERIQQETLFVTFPAENIGQAEADRALAAAANVDAYRLSLGTDFDQKAVATLLQAAAATSSQGDKK